MPPVANRVVMLTQQLEELREFESGLVVVGNVLEKVISTQKKLVQVHMYMYIHVWLASRPGGCSQPRELWFTVCTKYMYVVSSFS